MRLKELREEFGYSQKGFASLIGVPANTYNQWEKGNRQPDFQMMSKIADIFGVSIDYLLGRTDEKKPSVEINDEELDANVLVIRGRDGRYIRKVLTDEEIKSFETLFKNLPDLPDDV
ncbi:MAG: helix-turn-helix transcriptional regulator [Ruminococcaceae bacterium]|nr:helix-turn-helix transcriptional regulator [Oscillospiraceae bacterium]